MEADAKRKLQVVMLIAFLIAGARTLWIFHERSESSMPDKPALKERNEDDYVYLRPSHAHDLASARAVLKGNTVWVKAGNAVAYSWFTPPSHLDACKPTHEPDTICVLSPIAKLEMKEVVMSGDQMMAVFNFAPDEPARLLAPDAIRSVRQTTPTLYAVPIGVVKNGDATILIDDIFFLTDPHKLYTHWSKDAWSAIERHEITQGMSEMQAQAAMGLGRAPESGADGDYGNRTLVFTDPAHADKPVTVRFVDNAAVSVSK